jgi:hypothetical protein
MVRRGNVLFDLALRVFGCNGSTDVADQAIVWAVEPHGDGDLSDHLDVINLFSIILAAVVKASGVPDLDFSGGLSGSCCGPICLEQALP